VTDADAASAILAGQRLTPGYARGKTASTFGLSAHMFYRQGAMFIRYLKDRDAAAFGHFIASLEDGTAFQRSFEDAYRTDIGTTWGAFMEQIAQAQAPAADQ
jgi:hypothetical protein